MRQSSTSIVPNTSFLVVGYGILLSLLEDTFPGLDFETINNIFLTLGIFVMIIDTLILIAIWLRSDDLWLQINETYFDIVGDDEGMEQFKRNEVLKHNHGRIQTFFMVAYSFLLLSLILAVLMVVIGIFNVGFSYAFGYACREVVGALDGICIRFAAFDMREIKCGDDFLSVRFYLYSLCKYLAFFNLANLSFEQFCNDWAQKEMVMTLWGAFIVTVGHFFLISA